MKRDREDTLGKLAGMARKAVPPVLREPFNWLLQWAPVGWSHSHVFRQTERGLRLSNLWTSSEMETYQLYRLQHVVAHAAHYVPAYTKLYAERSVNRFNIRALSDLSRLPFLTRELLRGSPGKYRSSNMHDDELESWSTSIGNEAPAFFFHEKGQFEEILAACQRVSWEGLGYLWGRSPAIEVTHLGDGVRYAGHENKIYVSASALSTGTLVKHAAVLTKFKPQFLIGPGSLVSAFAEALRGQPTRLPLLAIFTPAGSLTAEQKAKIREAVAPKIYEWYGMPENAGFGAPCIASERTHLYPTTGLVEIVDEQGELMRRVGDVGEIVLTGLAAWATPFVRYRTGDRGVLGPSPCPACGRPFQTIDRLVDVHERRSIIDPAVHPRAA